MKSLVHLTYVLVVGLVENHAINLITDTDYIIICINANNRE